MALFADRYVYMEGASRQPGRQGLLWPVHAWRVLFPSQQQRLGANLFQEAILGLLRAGVRDVAELSALLALDPELLRYIIATQLQPNGWIDERMKLLPAGERLLDDADDRRLDLTLGYAFQDAVSGAWLPRFANSLAEVRPHALDDQGRPAFLLDRERGWIERPFVLPAAVTRPELLVGALNEAYRAYRRDLANAARDDRHAHDGVDFQAIEAVDAEPTPVYLLCEMYRDASEPQPWLVSDPFRLRKAASWLRKPLLALAPSNRALVQRMQRLTGEQDTALSAEDWLSQVEDSAQLALWSEYPFVAGQPLVSEHLMRLLRQRARLATQSRVNGEDVGMLAGESYNLIEAVLKWMLVRWPCDTSAWPRTHWRRDQARAEFNSLGLAAVTPQLVEQLAGQQPRGIAAAIGKQGGSFKALLAGAVFCAAVHPDHPFRTLPAASLQLERLSPLADLRNKASGHASGVKVLAADVQEHSKLAIEWMALFQTWY